MKLQSSVALLFSLGTLCFADPANLEEIKINSVGNIREFIQVSEGYQDQIKINFKNFNREIKVQEEWPAYMEWMCDLKNNISDFKIAVNSFSKGISNGNTQYVYLNLDKISNERKVEIIFYKHKF